MRERELYFGYYCLFYLTEVGAGALGFFLHVLALD
jgi:hypothetical protein